MGACGRRGLVRGLGVRPVTEAGPARLRELPGCMSVLLCRRAGRAQSAIDNDQNGTKGRPGEASVANPRLPCPTTAAFSLTGCSCWRPKRIYRT